MTKGKLKRPAAKPGRSSGTGEGRARPGTWQGPGKVKDLRFAARTAAAPVEGKSPLRQREKNSAILYGFHAVREALQAARRQFFALYATEAAAQKLAEDIARAGLSARIVTAGELGRRLGAGAAHQGVLLEASRLPALDIPDIISTSGIVLVLDQITDPHNIGAILRTAAAYGADALIVTERHTPEMTGTVAKAASGGLEHVPIIRVINLARALEELGEMGYLRLGLDSKAELSLREAPLKEPLALVVGAEGKGLRRLTREKCDLVVRLTMPGPIKSLNVSNACAVALALLHGED